MCGIVGVATRGILTPAHREQLRRMNDSLVHRGPDGQGQFFDGEDGKSHARVGLAMRRLSIIDVEGGGQPLFNEDRSIALVCNGEIYNSVELRADLERRGHHFRTGSDCETIAHLYEEEGVACLHRLRGMFAFALYDKREQRLLLARDRLGEKPLYIHRRDGELWFSSEARAMVRSGTVPFRMDADAITSSLHWGFVPGVKTAIQGIEKLDAGHYLSLDLQTFDCRIVEYWNPRNAPPFEGDPTRAVADELDNVSRLIVRSDVPVGICLSAGIDSSAVATLASRSYPGTICGVTVGFAGSPRQDERAGARRFARELRIPLIELELTPDDAADSLVDACAALDEPITDSAGPSIYSMMRRCRNEGLKVMLTGLGGDELFWGYQWMRDSVAMTESKYARLDRGASMRDYLMLSSPGRSYGQARAWLGDAGGVRSSINRWRTDMSHPDRMVFWDLVPEFEATRSALGSYFEPAWLASANADAPYAPFSFAQRPERVDIEVMCLVLDTYLRENGLSQSDRLSSANSVELRTPLVDYRLVELAVGIQKAQMVHRGAPKAVLLSALDTLLPEFVRSRPKTGFSSPWRKWARSTAARHGLLLIDGLLVQSGILRADRAAELRARLDSGRLGVRDHFAHAILRLELWARGLDQSATRAAA